MSTFRLDDVMVSYGRTPVLRGVSLAAEPGEVLALLGRNGTGKSSLVRCLLGHQEPDAGRVAVFGEAIWQARIQLNARIGVTPERPNAPAALDARQLAACVAPLYPGWDEAGYSARLERFRIPLATRFSRLSRGQQSLVHLALALAHRPELLVLDDPTLGLDAVARRLILDELLGELADRSLTVLLATQDFACVQALATRIALLQDGRLRFDEDVETLRARCRRLRFVHDEAGALDAELAELGPLERRSFGRSHEVVVERFAPELWAAAVRRHGLNDARAEPLALEEIFVAYAQEAPCCDVN